jgi:hypothetical protein
VASSGPDESALVTNGDEMMKESRSAVLENNRGVSFLLLEVALIILKFNLCSCSSSCSQISQKLNLSTCGRHKVLSALKRSTVESNA